VATRDFTNFVSAKRVRSDGSGCSPVVGHNGIGRRATDYIILSHFAPQDDVREVVNNHLLASRRYFIQHSNGALIPYEVSTTCEMGAPPVALWQ